MTSVMPATINLPDAIRKRLGAGAALAVSVSGGKDSQAMMMALTAARREHDWPGEIFAIHAHLGRAEWPQTLGHIERIVAAAGLPLVVVERTKGDLLARIQQRKDTLTGTGKPFWPSAAQRYCTAELKRGPINKHLRQYADVISAEGIRADESTNRAKKPEWERRTEIDCSVRTALTWNPILHWSKEDVWRSLGTSGADLAARRTLYTAGEHEAALDGWPAHVAYVFGNERLSCVFCVLGSISDLRVGARHNRDLLKEYQSMEEPGNLFKHGFSLVQLDLAPPVLRQSAQLALPCF